MFGHLTGEGQGLGHTELGGGGGGLVRTLRTELLMEVLYCVFQLCRLHITKQ